MRIAQVSGHYPPNFVSGGTLVPQRLARAVHEAGHESFVFAGYIDERRRPLETWAEDDGTGVNVTWLVTTPWTAWDDPRNWDNPDAESVFRSWLRRVQPDVVHFHSIQTLGVGLVEAAADEGAHVVLTMHDFWWQCARQFLVGGDMRPTSLVAALGTCDCDTGRPELRERAERLSRALDRVEVVLAPSRSAARVFAANGVDQRKLRIDENGLPDPQLESLSDGGAPARTGAGPLRLMYGGGAQAMKGFDVLVDAARMLGERSGLTLDAYGTASVTPKGLPSWFHRRAPFSPDALQDVMADHDILVLPSVMRESHSILTREALASGLAVICTDTLGPEEAVADGVNGLVIPAGNATALAEVLGSLANDPEAARALTGQGSASPIRRLSDQVASDLALYEELANAVEAGGAASYLDDPRRDAIVVGAQADLIHQVVFVVGIDSAPLRYRAHLPAEALRSRGHDVIVRHYRDPELLELAGTCDAMVLYRVPATTQVLELIDQVRDRDEPVPVLFDIDDLIFDPSLRGKVDGLEGMTEPELDLWWRGVERYRTTMEHCDAYIGSTDALCRRANELTGMRTYRFANGVGALLARASDSAIARPRVPGPVRIGYFSGTTTHDADWAAIEPAVVATMDRHPDLVLRLGGHLRPTEALSRFGDRVERIPFTAWYRLPDVLRDTDVCLAPLTLGEQFNEAKSAIKWLEAALVETPTIASPTQPFQEAIIAGRTGLLAREPEEWADALETLVSSGAARATMGALARREALLTYSPALQGVRYEEILAQAALDVREHGHRARSAWIDVADDEPFSSADSRLEPYEAQVGVLTAAPRQGRLRRCARRAVDVARYEGVPSLARRGTSFVVRRLRRTLRG